MLLATKLTIISNLCSSKGIKVMKNSTFFEKLCKYREFIRQIYRINKNVLPALSATYDKQIITNTCWIRLCNPTDYFSFRNLFSATFLIIPH